MPDQPLTAVPLLAKVPEDDIAALAALGARRNYPEGSALVEEGDPGDSLHTIMSGLVRIWTASRDGEEATITMLGPGDSLGELSLLDGRPRSATATAARDTESLIVSREDFLNWLSERPAAAPAILETMSLRVRRTTQQLSDFQLLDLSQRIAKQVLRELAVREAEPVEGGRRVRVRQQDLADSVGATREAVNHHLRSFQEAGWVRLGRASITVLDPQALRVLF
jgi:CRP-like cAMP-binding protein